MQKRWIKEALVIAGCSFVAVAAIVLVVMLHAVNNLFSDMCGNTVWKRAENPVSYHTAFLFERNCGATTGFSTQVSIINGDRLPDEGGNILVLDGYFDDMEIRWASANKLVISNMPLLTETFHKVFLYRGITIEYIEGEPPADQQSSE